MRTSDIVSVAALAASCAAFGQVPASRAPVQQPAGSHAPEQQAPAAGVPGAPAASAPQAAVPQSPGSTAMGAAAIPRAPAPAPMAAAPYAPHPMQAPVYTNPPPSPVARTPAPPAPPMPPVAGLPPDAPKLVINGGIYSESKGVRAAIVNGNVVHEGADLGSGVVLEQIKPSGVVLAYHGNRYNVVY